MKKKLIVFVVAIVSIALGLYFGVTRFSSDSMANKNNDRTQIYASVKDGLVFNNWVYNGDRKEYTSQNSDPNVEFAVSPNTYVSNIRLDKADIENVDEFSPRIYYTETAGEGFSEEKSFVSTVSVKNGDVYLKVDKNVYDLRIDFYESEGKTVSFDGMEINSRKLNINVTLTLIVAIVPVLVAWAVIETLSDIKGFKKDMSSMKRYKYLLYDLVTRDIKTKYRRSVLGILWSVLNPLLMMLVLTAVFSNVFKFNIQDFPIYYLTGYIMFNFLQESTNFSLTSIINAGGLIKKVYIPKYIFPLEKCLFSFVNMSFSLIAVVIVFAILGIKPHFTMLLFFVPMIYIFFFALGVSYIVATLNTFFRDVGHLYGIFTMVWMYLTPIIYPIEILPQWMISIVKLNPLYYYVEYFRNVMIYGKLPTLSDNLICALISVVTFMVGFVIFRKKQDKFILFI